MRDGQVELVNEAARTESGKSFAEFDELGLGGGRYFLCLVVASAGNSSEPRRAMLLIAAQPLADREHGGGEES